MKIIAIPIILFFCIIQIGYSQSEDGVVALDIPVRNSLMFNRFEINPTFSFVREQTKYITVTSKRELVQIEDAPHTYLFNYSGRFRENIGAGIGFFQQNYGVLTTFGGIVNFAYNIRLEEDSNLTFGISVGAYSSGVNSGKVIINSQDPALDKVPSNFLLTVNPGLNYGTGFMDFGLSINNVVTYNIKTSELIKENPKQGIQGHIMYTGYFGGYGFFSDSKFSALARSEFQTDASIFSGVFMLTVPKGIWAQVGYNTMYGASAGIGINITPQIAIEYNYEKPFMGLSDLGSSHEITLAYRFKNDNYYDYNRDDELAGLITPDRSSKKKSNHKKTPTAANQEREILTTEAAIIAAEEKAKLKAEEQRRLKIEEQTRLATEEQERSKAEEKLILATEAAAILAAETQARLAIEKQARLEAEEQARLALEEQARLAIEEQARLEAEEQARLAAEELIKLESEKQARLEAEAQEKLAAEKQSRLANEEQARLEAEAQARLAEEELLRLKTEETPTENLIKNPTDNIGTSLSELAAQTEVSKIAQAELLVELETAVAAKEKDLKDLKEENDLSDQDIYVEPKPFKSISEENSAIEMLIITLDTVILRQKKKIGQLASLLETRVKTINNPNDATNLYYQNALALLKSEQDEAIRYRESLVSSLEQITIATDFERKRRIKRAAYDNDQDRFKKDRNTLNILRRDIALRESPLTIENFDFGEDRGNNIRILKNVKNTESGYYLVLAVHSDIKKRDEFLTQVISSGNRDVDFFYDVNTSEYYIYTKKFYSIEEANSAIMAKENKVYNEKLSIIKIEN